MRGSLVAVVVLLIALPARALPSYAVGTIPVAAGQFDLEFPVAGPFRAQVGLTGLSQGTYEDRSPFAYMSLLSPSAWLHYDGVQDLRLSLGFHEVFSFDVAPLGLPGTHEERFVFRARLQQPRGASALYQMLQLDLRSFDDPTGNHQIVFRPRLRIGVGFNLDSARFHAMSLYQEAALRFADSSYTTRAFEFYRAVAGYSWTTKRGLFVTASLVGQVSVNPAGNLLNFFYGPVLSLAYRIAPPGRAAESPPESPEVEVQ